MKHRYVEVFCWNQVDFADLLFLTMLVLKETGHLQSWSWAEIILLYVGLGILMAFGKRTHIKELKEEEAKESKDEDKSEEKEEGGIGKEKLF